MFSAISAALLAMQTIIVGLLVANATPLLLPVTVDIGGGIQLTTVNLGAAVAVLLAFSAVARGAAVWWPSPVIRWVELSQVSAITVFLVAQLNGVRDVAALVALYAITAGSTLFLVLHTRTHAGRWPFSFGAAVGIVPWGVIAFYQVGAIVAGAGPAPLIRVITVAMLAVAAVYWLLAYRPMFSDRTHTIVTTVGTSLFAWLVAYVVLSGVS